MPLRDDDKMPFGPYKGLKMIDVPNHHLRWLESKDWIEEKYPEVYEYIEDNWETIHNNKD